ncbi:MAG TPA: azurin [Rhodanobacteraceae bacterium]|nr:azurin [Rhodanobacteraceae bacterium]
MPTNGKPAATVSNCSTEIEASDAMQYNVGSIAVPSSCTNFKITLKHTGKLPVASMGHDVVITKQSDMQAVDQESAAAGLDNGYIKAGDSRIIAHTKLIGGGQTTSVSFPVSKIKSGGPYVFFCSFPGHSALMHGTISVQ